MIGERSALAAEVLKLARQGKPPREIAAILGVRRSVVSSYTSYARSTGRIPPRKPVPVKNARQLVGRMKHFGLKGIGKFGQTVAEMPDEVHEWLFDQCTSEKSLSDVAGELILAAYDAEKSNSGT